VQKTSERTVDSSQPGSLEGIKAAANSNQTPAQADRSERSGLSEQRRRELADFLRTRREKLKPEQLGITQVSRRRTPGLRREEVAEIAGVGTTWYTWLEQARDIQPSAEVLKRLSSALMMNPAETRHLFTLAGRAAPVDVEEMREVPSENLIRLLHAFPFPGLLLGSRWDLIAINSEAQKTFKALPALVETRGNWLHFYFLQLDRSNVLNWEVNARKMISDFRLSVSDSLDQPWVSEVVDDLRAKSPEFASLWREHDVTESGATLVEFRTENGVVKYERSMLRAAEDPRLKLVLYAVVTNS
jgi:transcriptional regulator with XRE-family HTH domain